MLMTRAPSRVPHASTKWVPPADRVRRWNIRPGDKVRLLVGKPHEKYMNDVEKAASGWKVYKVKGVDMAKNWLVLEGLSVSQGNSLLIIPVIGSSTALPARLMNLSFHTLCRKPGSRSKSLMLIVDQKISGDASKT
jgi:hypothetical protein